MASDLMKKLLKVGKLDSAVLNKSEVYNNQGCVNVGIPSLDIALSGDIDGGLRSGITTLAGPSRHYKSGTGLKLVSSYMKKHEESICLFYDSEYGTPDSYWAAAGIDPERVIHIPIDTLEELKFDLPQKLEQIQRGDKAIIFIDSVGNLASKKEAQDALDGNAKQDMTRAKEAKSLWRIVTPTLTRKDIPCIAIAHTYKTIEMYSKDVVSGGTGIMYSSNTIWIFGRSQEKDDEGLKGFNFTINIEKSRFVKEKSKIPFVVTFKGGINRYSGILELAMESGDVVKPKNGWYQLIDKETGEMLGNAVRASKTESEEFLGVVLNRQSFKDFVKQKYQLPSHLISDEEIDGAVETLMEDEDDQ